MAEPGDTAEYWRGEFEGMKAAFEEYASSSKGIEAELEVELDAVRSCAPRGLCTSIAPSRSDLICR